MADNGRFLVDKWEIGFEDDKHCSLDNVRCAFFILSNKLLEHLFRFLNHWIRTTKI
jgi:hypothetical protein